MLFLSRKNADFCDGRNSYLNHRMSRSRKLSRLHPCCYRPVIYTRPLSVYMKVNKWHEK